MPNFPPAPDHSDDDPNHLHQLVGKLLATKELTEEDSEPKELTDEDKERLSEIHSVGSYAAAWRPLLDDAGLDRMSFQAKSLLIKGFMPPPAVAGLRPIAVAAAGLPGSGRASWS